MWLMTKYGFYSIVQKRPDEYHIRARERKDLENLVAGVPLPEAQIQESDITDYAFRIIAPKADVHAVLHFLGDHLDYSNFKARIDRTPGQERKPYHGSGGSWPRRSAPTDANHAAYDQEPECRRKTANS